MAGTRRSPRRPTAHSPAGRAHGASLRARRLDAPDQLVELGRGVANVMGQAANDFERFFGLADFQKLSDEVFVLLQGLQQARELRSGVVELLGGALGLV